MLLVTHFCLLLLLLLLLGHSCPSFWAQPLVVPRSDIISIIAAAAAATEAAAWSLRKGEHTQELNWNDINLFGVLLVEGRKREKKRGNEGVDTDRVTKSKKKKKWKEEDHRRKMMQSADAQTILIHSDNFGGEVGHFETERCYMHTLIDDSPCGSLQKKNLLEQQPNDHYQSSPNRRHKKVHSPALFSLISFQLEKTDRMGQINSQAPCRPPSLLSSAAW